MRRKFPDSDTFRDEGSGWHFGRAEGYLHPTVWLTPAVWQGIESISAQPVPAAATNDTYSNLQWHLSNTGQTGGTPGMDIDVTRVWSDYTGGGVTIGVVDTGIQYSHPDLVNQVNTAIDHDAYGHDNDASAGTGEYHATSVAGTIVAQANNYQGVAGVAYGAEVAGFRMAFGSGTQSQIAENFQLQSTVDISNNSWGYGGFFYDNFDSAAFASASAALEYAVANGRDGLGTVFVFAAGNDRTSGQNVNYHAFQNSPYTIAVAAIDDTGKYASFSTPGAALLVSAPGVDIVTTDRTGADGYVSGDYVSISGTSFSSPITAGVVALMLEANPTLGYRDVQEILAYSARQIDAGSAGWKINGAENWNGGGLHFSHDYGFGLVDAYAAVRLAETWTASSTYDNLASVSATSSPWMKIYDAATISDSITIQQGLQIDHVEVSLSLDHSWIGDLTVRLISPDGTESILVQRPGQAPGTASWGTSQDDIRFDLYSTQHWGETGEGVWTLKVTDSVLGDRGTLESWTLTLLGDPLNADDLYVFTEEFSQFAPAGYVLSDTGGIDTINAAAVSSNSSIWLDGSQASTIDGSQFLVDHLSVIENVFAGDGNDRLVGNDAANQLHGGRGNDTLIGGAGDDLIEGGIGNDSLDGGDGSDTALFGGLFGDYLITVASSGVTVQDTVSFDGYDGFDTLTGFEFLQFADTLVPLNVSEPGTHAPTAISLNAGLVPENYAGALVGQLTVDDPDLGDSHTFVVSDDRFTVSSGYLKLNTGVSLDFESEPAISLQITAIDVGGLEFTQGFDLSVADRNDAPTNLTLDALPVAENAPGAVIGAVAVDDQDAGDSHTVEVHKPYNNPYITPIQDPAGGSGGAAAVDPASVFSIDIIGIGGSPAYGDVDERFEVVDGQLKLKDGVALDYETDLPVNVVLVAKDSAGAETYHSFEIAVTDANEAPTAIALNNLAVAENDAGAVIGAVAVDDQDAGDSHTFTVSDDRFEVVGSDLKLKDGVALDFEAEPAVALQVTATDAGGLDHTQSFDIAVGNVNEAPADILLGADSLDENAAGAVVGAIAVDDPDAGDTHTFALSDDRFEVVGGDLKLKDGVALDFETDPSVALQVTATDAGGESYTKDFAIVVRDVNEGPTAIALDNVGVVENDAGAVIGSISVDDVDPGDSHDFIVSDDRFEILGGDLKLKDGIALDFEAAPTVTVGITATDAGGLSHTQSFDIVVGDANDAPTAVHLSALVVSENVAGAVIASVSVDDQDTLDSHGLTVSDNRFEVVGGDLKLKDGIALNFETEPIVTIGITATDSGGLEYTQTFTLAVAENNLPPVAVDDSYDTGENSVLSVVAADGVILGASGTDMDPDGDLLTVTAVAGDSSLVGVGVGATGGGSFTLAADGSFQFDPGSDFDYLAVGDSAVAEISYAIGDGKGGSANATVGVSVSGANDDPLADDDSATTTFGTPVDISVLDNDSDIDGGTLVILSAGGAANGSVAVNADGILTYTPDAGFSGGDTFAYTVGDGQGGSASASVDVAVAPAAASDTLSYAGAAAGVVATLAPDAFIFSTASSASLPGIDRVADEDLTLWDGDSFALFFNGSDHELSREDIDAVSLRPGGGFVFSLASSASIAGLPAIDDSDIVAWDRGGFSFVMDGASVGLSDFGEDITGAHLLNNGNLAFVTQSNGSIAGIGGSVLNFGDGDIIEVNFADVTVDGLAPGEGRLIFAEANFTSSADIDALSVLGDGSIVLSTTGTASLPGLVSFSDEDLVLWNGGTASLLFDGSDPAGHGLGDSGEDIDATHVFVNAGAAAGADFDGIVNLIGSEFADTLIGNADANSLVGGGGDDLLIGGGGDDTLAGGQGVDLLFGGSGGDTFVFAAADLGSGTDAVADFAVADNDTLDLRDLFIDAGAIDGESLGGYLTTRLEGSDTVLAVDVNGGGDGFVDLACFVNITLDDTSLVQMLAEGSILVA